MLEILFQTVETRRNRKTGSAVALLTDGYVWVTLCDTHGGFAEHPNKTVARDWLADPVVWCEGCEARS